MGSLESMRNEIVLNNAPALAGTSDYMQTAMYSSWRDVNNLGLKQAILKTNPETTQRQLPKDLRGEVKAYYYPKKQTDWLLAPDIAYKPVIFLDSEGLGSYAYMEAKWMPGKGEDLTRD